MRKNKDMAGGCHVVLSKPDPAVFSSQPRHSLCQATQWALPLTAMILTHHPPEQMLRKQSVGEQARWARLAEVFSGSASSGHHQISGAADS
jgi:hypothetical protein